MTQAERRPPSPNIFSPFENSIHCIFNFFPPTGHGPTIHSAVFMLACSEESLWASDFSSHPPVPNCMTLCAQMQSSCWDRVLKASGQTGFVHQTNSLLPTARACPGLALAGTNQVVQQVYPATLVKCLGQLSHCGPFGAFPHQPLLKHLVNFLFQSISFIVMVDFIDLRLSEAQLAGTVFPLPSQVFPDRVQVFISQTSGVIKDGLVSGSRLFFASIVWWLWIQSNIHIIVVSNLNTRTIEYSIFYEVICYWPREVWHGGCASRYVGLWHWSFISTIHLA